MARVFITGSTEGLGRMAGELLIEQGHAVVLHARNAAKADRLRAAVPGAEAVVLGDLGSMSETRGVAEQVNALGSFDAVIHNAAVGYKESKRKLTVDGLPEVFAVNSLAPYLLTALIARPNRLVYLSSELHHGGSPSLDDLLWERRHWNGNKAYSDTKLHDVWLAFAMARRWTGVPSNAVHPGWVATRMGGERASGDLQQGHLTQAWLAVSDEPAAQVTGRFFFHLKEQKPAGPAGDIALQDRFMQRCAEYTGVEMPAA